MNYELPEQFAQFGDARKNGFLRVKSIKENGGKVAGTFCTFTPQEILDAAGVSPVSLCGMSEETIPAAEAHLPKNLCPLIKSSYGFAVSDKCPYTYFSDIIVGETTCDGKKKMYELLGDMKDVYLLHLPQGDREHALEQWTQEVQRFRAFLEEKFGEKI
ncbi:MAG: 2-hydroxyacyl-CoA dehydratase, partial [Firmicutes bacterium]|nr:2-hydroxyacyl-CoA dehydratase [Bacillota bacterium]